MPTRSQKAEARELITLCALNSFMEDNSDGQEDDILLALSILETHRYSSNRLAKPIKVKNNWWEEALFETEQCDQLFKTNFRMTRPTFWSLCQSISGMHHKLLPSS